MATDLYKEQRKARKALRLKKEEKVKTFVIKAY